MKNVLVVDDSQYNVTLLTAILRKKGVNVLTAKDGDEAMVQFKKVPPDLVLLDFMMPKRSGVEILGEMKEIDPKVIAIIVTSLTSTEDVKKAKEAGASGYIVKPFEPEKIYAILQKFKIIE